MAYGRNGDLAEADLASAQAAFARGDNKTARELAARAKTRFPGRLAGMGKGGRHRRFQQNGKKSPAIRSITQTKDNDNDIEPTHGSSDRSRNVARAAGGRQPRRRFPPISARRSGPSSRSISWRIRRCCRTSWRSWKSSSRRRRPRNIAPRWQRTTPRFQFAAPGRARQSARQRHHGRVLRLQLRLLQARAFRHA